MPVASGRQNYAKQPHINYAENKNNSNISHCASFVCSGLPNYAKLPA